MKKYDLFILAALGFISIPSGGLLLYFIWLPLAVCTFAFDKGLPRYSVLSDILPKPVKIFSYLLFLYGLASISSISIFGHDYYLESRSEDAICGFIVAIIIAQCAVLAATATLLCTNRLERYLFPAIRLKSLRFRVKPNVYAWMMQIAAYVSMFYLVLITLSQLNSYNDVANLALERSADTGSGLVDFVANQMPEAVLIVCTLKSLMHLNTNQPKILFGIVLTILPVGIYGITLFALGLRGKLVFIFVPVIIAILCNMTAARSCCKTRTIEDMPSRINLNSRMLLSSFLVVVTVLGMEIMTYTRAGLDPRLYFENIKTIPEALASSGELNTSSTLFYALKYDEGKSFDFEGMSRVLSVFVPRFSIGVNRNSNPEHLANIISPKKASLGYGYGLYFPAEGVLVFGVIGVFIVTYLYVLISSIVLGGLTRVGGTGRECELKGIIQQSPSLLAMGSWMYLIFFVFSVRSGPSVSLKSGLMIALCFAILSLVNIENDSSVAR